MIQAQIPLRLPCYDLSPLAKPRFDHRAVASSGPHSGALTGGVCKEQGRIHRALLTRDYYRIQLHEGEFQPSIRTTTAFGDYLRLSASGPTVTAIVARVLPGTFGAY